EVAALHVSGRHAQQVRRLLRRDSDELTVGVLGLEQEEATVRILGDVTARRAALLEERRDVPSERRGLSLGVASAGPQEKAGEDEERRGLERFDVPGGSTHDRWQLSAMRLSSLGIRLRWSLRT